MEVLSFHSNQPARSTPSSDLPRQPNRSLHSLCSAHTNISLRVSSWPPKQKLVTLPVVTTKISLPMVKIYRDNSLFLGFTCQRHES